MQQHNINGGKRGKEKIIIIRIHLSQIRHKEASKFLNKTIEVYTDPINIVLLFQGCDGVGDVGGFKSGYCKK